MSYLNQINTIHLNYLAPLSKWRVMDLESLRKEAHGPNYHNFAKIIRRLEKAKILHGYRSPFNKKKYVFFTSSAQKELEEEKGIKSVSKESLGHDIKVTEISQAFLELNLVDEVKLEHQLLGTQGFKSAHKVVPDSMFTIFNGKYTYNLAFELEITQKSKPRVQEKAKQYMISSKYDYVIFFFPRKQLLNSYKRMIEDAVGKDNMSKFLFICDENIIMKEVDLEKLDCHFKDQVFKLSDLFRKLNDG